MPIKFEIELPEPVLQALYQVIYHMFQGHAISIIPINKEITIQESAGPTS
jgi:hypothetical protein